MPVSSSTEHWIKPDALTINLNHFGDPDYLQVSVLAGAVVMAFKQDVIGYNAAHNYRTWPLEAANTYLETTSAYNVYARLTRSEVNARALVVYDTVLRDIEGREITYAEDGSEVLGEANSESFFVFLGQISASVNSNGESVQREWTIDFRVGNLDTNQYRNTESGGEWVKMFRLNKVTDMIDVLKTFSSAVFQKYFVREKPVTDIKRSIDSDELVPVSDESLTTSKYVEKKLEGFEGKYLRKDQDDRSTGTISSDKGMEVGHFIQGMLGGSGAKMYMDENGKVIVEADKAYFREEMLVPKITFNSIDVVSGEMAQTFAYGTIKSVDTATQIATLDLLDDEYGTLHVYDILRGTFHRLEGGNNTEYSKDKNGFHNYSGFSTCYFTPTEILVNEKGHMEFRYALQDSDGMHPCAGMNFYAYGNFYDKDRQSVTYQTREYTRRLRNMDTWVINPSKNIAMQDGNLNDLEVGNFKMSGWGTFETNSYLIGTQIQFSPDQLEELKGLNGADAYSVTLSSYDGVIKVDATGTKITSGMTSEFNVVTGSMNVVTGENNVIVADFRLKTIIQVSKGNTPLYFSPNMEAGSYMATVSPVGCVAEVSSGVVTVTEITDLKNCYVDITIVCEGNHPVEKTYRINAVYDGDSSEIETIYSKLKEPAAPENVHPYVDNDVWSHDVHEDNIWMAVSTRKNNEWTDWQVSRVLGVSSFKSTAFIRTNNTPATPTGGSYESPLPTDKDENGNLLWSDGIPEGESILWASVCTFHSNGHYPEDAKWSTPRALTDTADFEAIYSPKEIYEEIPSGFFKDGVELNPEWESVANAAGWYDDPNQWDVEGNEYKGKPTIWMATNTAKNGVWEGWRISRVLGERGADAVSYEITPPSLNLRETLTGTITPSATVFTCYASNKEERVETEATWGIKGRKDGQDDWTTFDYTHVGETMIFEPNQQDRYDEYLITAVPNGQTTALEVQVVSIKDRRGVMPRYCGRWKEGTKYYYNDEVRDIVTLGGNVFQVYPYNPNGYVEARPNPDLEEDSHDEYWEKANKFSFVAMDTALIDSAHIAGFTFFVDGQDAEGNPLGRMESANKKIVLDTVNERIISTDAEISGSINVGSMSYKVLNADGGTYDLTDYGMVVGWGTFKLPSVAEAHSLDIKIFFENWSRVARDCKIVSVDNTPIRVIGENGYAINVTEYLLPDANTLSSIILVYDSTDGTPYWMVNSSVGASTGGGISLFVDNKLDAESEYPVQNKVIYEKFQSLGPFTYNKNWGYWTFNGDLLVQGGVTSHVNEGRYTPSTIMDGVQVDGTTIIKDEYGNLAINPDIELGGGEVQEMTAKQILDKLVTIDGDGSGLDADKVDGFESSRMFISSRGNIDYSSLDTYTSFRYSGSTGVKIYNSNGTHTHSDSLYTFRSNGSYLGFELHHIYNANGPLYRIRSLKDIGGYTGWKTIAFTDSDITGNAATATKATKDGDGNVITTTYAKLDGSNVTGTWNINISGNAATATDLTGNITNKAPQLAASTESNEIKVVNNPDSSITTNNPTSISAIRKALQFRWYDDYWQMGAIRGDSTASVGWGITYGRSNLRFRVTTSGATAYGNLLVTGGVTSRNTSDERLKENIRPISAGEELLKLGGVYQFEYCKEEVDSNPMYEGTHVGMLYQNVKGTSMERMCQEREDGYGALNYLDTSFISLIAGAGMEHEKKIRELERKIERLERIVEQLTNRNNG